MVTVVTGGENSNDAKDANGIKDANDIKDGGGEE